MERLGDPEAELRFPRGLTLEQRLRRRILVTNTGCWEFQGYRNEHGYGQLKVNGRMPATHRLAYELWVADIPPGLLVCHHCDNPPCCNPEHLFVGDAADNVADMVRKGRNRPGHGNPGPSLRVRADRLRAAAALAAGHPEDWKQCSRCTEWQEPAAFGKNKRRPDGLQVYCRPCTTAYLKERRDHLREGADGAA